jgi:predicted nucleotidyltransferase component of viral defense system
MPSSLGARSQVELFHLVFLRALVARGEDKGLFVLKGGCNLRFFFGSMRYSEDIDLDVTVVAKGTLKNKVERLLISPIVTAPLRSQAIEIVDVTAPKQTDATQRWKVGLRSASLPVPLRTKIEFSRRGQAQGAAFQAVDPEVLRRYGLSSFAATHYGLPSAIAQKVEALAGRSTPQARDVFDLNHLASRLPAGPRPVRLDPKTRSKAMDHARAISFDEYAAQVVSYLDPVQRELFEGRDAWTAMQDAVVSYVEASR